MRTWLPRVGSKYGTQLAFGTALFLASMLFILIPLTQTMPGIEEEDVLIMRETSVISMPPPPAPPPDQDRIVQVEERNAAVEDINLDSQPTPSAGSPSVAIQSLQLSLSPGTGDAVAMGGPLAKVETGVGMIGGAAGDGLGDGLSKMFTFSDLRETPRILYVPAIRYPESLIRRRINQGEVVMLIEIDQEGRAKVERVISSTRPELEAVAVDAIRRARFSIPKIDGRPVRVRGRLPLTLHAPN